MLHFKLYKYYFIISAFNHRSTTLFTIFFSLQCYDFILLKSCFFWHVFLKHTFFTGTLSYNFSSCGCVRYLGTWIKVGLFIPIRKKKNWKCESYWSFSFWKDVYDDFLISSRRPHCAWSGFRRHVFSAQSEVWRMSNCCRRDFLYENATACSKNGFEPIAKYLYLYFGAVGEGKKLHGSALLLLWWTQQARVAFLHASGRHPVFVIFNNFFPPIQ